MKFSRLIQLTSTAGHNSARHLYTQHTSASVTDSAPLFLPSLSAHKRSAPIEAAPENFLARSRARIHQTCAVLRIYSLCTRGGELWRSSRAELKNKNSRGSRRGRGGEESFVIIEWVDRTCEDVRPCCATCGCECFFPTWWCRMVLCM